MIEIAKTWLMEQGLSEAWALVALRSAAMVLTILLSYLAFLVARRVLLRLITRLVRLTKTKWDDILLEEELFSRAAQVAPALVIYVMAGVAFVGIDPMILITRIAAQVYMIVILLLVIDALLTGLNTIYRTFEIAGRFPIRSYVQTVKIIIKLLGVIFILATILRKSPWGLVTALGGISAILLLVFKDAILGFVAGIQLNANNMVRVGDWIELPQYGADGDVVDITLTTVKVQNWDKTISTIPSYDLVSKSFKNWRGMQESEGRRIKRALLIDMNTIRFCDEEMLDRFRAIRYISEYIDQKKRELQEYNEARKVDDSDLVNRRRLTNVGTFRAYVVAYLKNHPKIHQGMTFLVRQLPSSPQGLPIEIYVFSNDQVWAHYEDIQADIFDHILATVPEFDLRVFQEPSGGDVGVLAAGLVGGVKPSS